MAAVMVVLHHAGSLAGSARSGRLEPLLSVGDGGVAVFFVLSGFLIYRPFVIRHVEGRGGEPWRVFWWRRVLRIVPAYWFVLTFFWVIGSFELGGDWWRYYLFLQIYDRYTVLGGIVQAWSLCTEISFYLLVPLWAAVLARLVRSGDAARALRLHLAGCAVLWCSAFAFRWGVPRWAPGQRGLAFNWLPANMDLFATGMALAVLVVWAERRPSLGRSLDHLTRVVWPFWFAAAGLFIWYAHAVGPADFVTGYEGWFWQRRQLVFGVMSVLLMLPVLFAPAVRSPLRRAWSWRPVVWTGTVSYGLYLWHLDWMERSIDRIDPFSTAGSWSGWISARPGDAPLLWLVAVGLGLGLVWAALSWHLLERPLQRFRDLVRR